MSKSTTARFHVYSTLSAPTEYSSYRPVRESAKAGNNAPGEVPVLLTSVTIAGGANVANARSLMTPRGIVTTISAEELEVCNADPVFQMHKENGFIFVEEATTDRVDAEEKVEKLDLTKADKSAPLTLEKSAKSAGAATKLHNKKD